MIGRKGKYHSKAGFTLIEVLAAFAITAIIIAASGALIHHVGLSFNRGVNGVTEAERFALAMDRLAGDFGAAHFISLRSMLPPPSSKDKKPVSGALAFVAQSTKITFVSSGNAAARGAEVVTLKVQTSEDDISELVRFRGAWLGPGTDVLDDAGDDAVVLLKGAYDISFSFGQCEQDGGIIWLDGWSGQAALPRLVRLNLRDRATGASLLAGSEFIVRSDASITCSSSCDTPGKAQDPSAQDKKPI